MEIKSLITVLAIIFIHWVADFVCQTDWQATNKSKNNKALLSHVLCYSFIWLDIGICYGIFLGIDYIDWTVTKFILITFVCHFITDYFTSRLNTKLWNEKKFHYFFVSVGFDQFLHYTQLLLTYYYLTK